MLSRATLAWTVAAGVTVALAVPGAATAGPAGQPRMLAAPPSRTSRPADPSRLADPAAVLPAGWQQSKDRVVTTAGDQDGFHVLVAEQAAGYQWQTVATLTEPGFDTDQWIGQSCMTGSGDRAVVVYAPREFTNHVTTADAGGFVAVVDLGTGAVRKLPQRASLAYFNPGCGAGEDVALSTLREDRGTTSTVVLVNATTGAVSTQVRVAGQVTSAVPFGGGVAGVLGSQVVTLGAKGATTTLAADAGVPFRLHPDRTGGLAYQVATGDRVETRRLADGRSSLLGTGRLGSVQVVSTAGQLFVVGPDSGAVKVPKGWARLDAPVNVTASSSGALVVTGTAAEKTDAASPTKPDSGRLSIEATLTGNQRKVSFAVQPAPAVPAHGAAASPAGLLGGPSDGASGSSSRSASGSLVAVALPPSTVSYDPDRACAVPRNDPAIQTLQPTAAQVEWAVDRAVLNQLMVNRPINWMGSGMPVSWNPQTLFPIHSLTGGGNVPAQVLLGILAQESNTMQASPHAVDGVTGNFNHGGFYNDGLTWSPNDCGYGVGQVTSGMSVPDRNIFYSANQQKAIATDYASNIAASLNALIDKWNQLKSLNIIANDGSTQYIENWYLAAWAYNTGVQPNALNGNTTGCSPGPSCNDGAGNWGLGWSNNPANPNYPADRGMFNGNNAFDTKHPNLWPYQEKVIGWANTPVARYDYAGGMGWRPAYSRGTWSGLPHLPTYSTFCVASVNHCSPQSATDVNGKPGAGRCMLMDLHCWWHQSNVTWVTCVVSAGQSTPCGTQSLPFANTATEPANASVYPPDCSMSGVSGAAIVDEVTTDSAVPCAKSWTNTGSFTLSFPAQPPAGCSSQCINYPGKIDFHQLSTGFGGHLWFTHTAATVGVTGTWKPPSTSVGWTRIKVHIPQSGATTKQAEYVINLGNGQTRHRVVNQAWFRNTWVDLGAFNLAAGAFVSLSNAGADVAPGRADGGDVAFDALAFIPSSQPVTSYVALGDSYSSGEANIPFDADSDQKGWDECHRSATQAYPSLLRLPGQSSTIAAMAANNQANFHSLACSGAQAVDMTQTAVEPGNTDNTDWREVNHYRYGEVNQIDESGWLDQDTKLVTVSVGGNDVGFGDVVAGCIIVLACIGPNYYLTRSFGDWDPKVNRVDPQPLTTYEPYLISKLRTHLAATYKQIHLKAPNARIVVVGYPKAFTIREGDICQGFDTPTQKWFNQMHDLLIPQITNAINDTKAAYPTLNISFVDVTNGFLNHAVCEIGMAQWINGIDPLNKTSSFHPNSNGQAAYGSIVNAAL